MTAEQVADEVEKNGGVLKLEGDSIRCSLPKDALHLADALKAHKQELVRILRQRGGRIAAFPHCPRCASYALYRKDNIGDYECQTCGLMAISEEQARRVM